MDWEALDEWIRQRADDGEYATIRTFLDEVLDKSRGDDEYREASEAKMREWEERGRGYESEIERLKSHNYDLLMQLPKDDEIEGDGVVEEVVEEDGEIYHIDNLFVDDNEKGGIA